MREKVCIKCQELKPLTSFYKQPSNIDGRRGTCSKCYLHEQKLKRLGRQVKGKEVNKKAYEIRALREEVKRLTKKDAVRLEEIINRCASLKMYDGYLKEYDLLIDMCYYKIDRSLGAGNKY